MKLFRLAVAAVFALAFGNAYAFHSGGVADCEGCHSMHNSFEGSANVSGMAQFASGPYLLKAQDQSGACLNCHEASPGSYHISTPGINPLDSTTPTQLTPGGDFSWLKVATFGVTTQAAAGRRGHNVMATNNGYIADNKFTKSDVAMSFCEPRSW